MNNLDKNKKCLIFILVLNVILILYSVIIFIRVIPNKNTKQKNLIKIEILKMPNKMEYKEREKFDKSGMIIKAIYDDGTESNIDNYAIDKTSPLSIYDSLISITYNGKTENITIKIVNEENIEIRPNLSKQKYTLETIENIITRFEIEDSDVSKWIISNNEKENKIIERNDASRGKFLSGIDENISNDVQLNFNLNLKYKANIVMLVSYSQKEKWKNYDIDLSSIYTFIIDENMNIDINGDTVLKSREDITNWEVIKYKKYTLEKGKHSISIKVSSNIEKGTPNIDYIDFKTEKIEDTPVDPDKDKMPSNDFHTLLQYEYLTDKNIENIFSYAKGVQDLSRPKGNILDFSESVKELSSSYVIQISSSENFKTEDTKIIKDLKEKRYILKNLKLGQKIYYRGAINERELENSKIYDLTVNTLPPRNLDIPGVDNSRDIGGYRTSLVENGIINQGLYYRTAKITNINEEGKKILTEDLGVKIEIDLRDIIGRKGPYVDGVEYHLIPIKSHTKSTRFENFNQEYIKIFNLISQADKNPIVLHCAAGADRTGIITFALLTLLGCDYNDVAKDYLFTNFGVQGKRDINSEFKIWWSKLNNYEGETKAEQCKNWLISKGIEESTLEHIREIFINGYKQQKINLYNYVNEEINGYILSSYDRR